MRNIKLFAAACLALGGFTLVGCTAEDDEVVYERKMVIVEPPVTATEVYTENGVYRYDTTDLDRVDVDRVTDIDPSINVQSTEIPAEDSSHLRRDVDPPVGRPGVGTGTGGGTGVGSGRDAVRNNNTGTGANTSGGATITPGNSSNGAANSNPENLENQNR